MQDLGEIGEWRCDPPTLDVRRLLGVHKYKDLTKVRPVILKAAEKAIEIAREVSVPCAVHTTAQIGAIDEDGMLLSGGVRLNCAAFQNKLSMSYQILAFIITLGPELDTTVSDGFADGSDPLGPLFLDTAGWLMIEAVTREFSKQQKRRYLEDGHQLSARMAPGYDYPVLGSTARAGWDLTDQSELFGLFREQDLPVELLESGGMIPRMSRSGIFGIRKAD